MKQTYNILRKTAGCLAAAAILTGCHFLDVDPELGLTDEDVFSTYTNFKMYFDYAFGSPDGINMTLGYPLHVDSHDKRFCFVSSTDAADCGRYLTVQQQVKTCNLSQDLCNDFSFGSRRPIAKGMFRIIRIANRTLENIDRLTNATESQKNDLIGQAYFVRGYAHFVLCRFFGGMPYLDKALESDDEWDLSRLSAHDTYVRAAEDFDKACTYLKAAGKMRRDALPGEAGHLNGKEMDRPTGVAAMAMKGRALLYAASPLNNTDGTDDWAAAANACAEALKIAEEWQYSLLPFSNYTDNYYGTVPTTNELIMSWYFTAKSNSGLLSGTLAYPQSNYSKASGVCPTQNFVDKFETRWGDPLTTEAERAEAVEAGHYADQDPYSNRDPRFDINIIHDGSTNQYVTGAINIYYDPATRTWPTTNISGVTSNFGVEWGSVDGSSMGYSNTGYYLGKPWRGDYGSKSTSHHHIDPVIRMAELYLNYAEAVNEAYGPNGTAGSCTITAKEAVNKIRARAGMPEVLEKFTYDTDSFRERIRNERNVELAFESNHYYFDIRRWMTAPQVMTQPLTGMYVEAVEVSSEYPKGRKYERRSIPKNRQSVWKDCMYWWPFPDEQANTMKNFVNNEKWM